MSIETDQQHQEMQTTPAVRLPSPTTMQGPQYPVETEEITRTVTQLGFALPGAPTQEQRAARTHDESGLAVDSLRRMRSTARENLENNKRILEAIHAYDELRLDKLITTAEEISGKMDVLVGQRDPIQTDLDVAATKHTAELIDHKRLIGGMGELEQMKEGAKEEHEAAFQTLLDKTREQNYSQGHIEGTASARYKAGPTRDEFYDMQLQGEYGVASGYDSSNYQRTFVETDKTRQEKAERDAAISQALEDLQRLNPALSSIDQSIGVQQLTIDQTQARLDELNELMNSRREGLMPLDEEIEILHRRLEALKLDIFNLYAELRDRSSPLKVLHEIVRSNNGDNELLEMISESQPQHAIEAGDSSAEEEELSGEVLSDTTIRSVKDQPQLAGTGADVATSQDKIPRRLMSTTVGDGLLKRLINLTRKGSEG